MLMNLNQMLPLKKKWKNELNYGLYAKKDGPVVLMH